MTLRAENEKEKPVRNTNKHECALTYTLPEKCINTQEQRNCGLVTLHCSQSANWDHGNSRGSIICGCRHDSGHRMDRSDIHRLTGWGCF